MTTVIEISRNIFIIAHRKISFSIISFLPLLTAPALGMPISMSIAPPPGPSRQAVYSKREKVRE